MESLDPNQNDKNTIDIETVAEKLRTLPEDEFSPKAIQFAGALATKLPTNLNPTGFALTAQLVQYDQAVGKDLFGGTEEDLKKAGWGSEAQEKFEELSMEFPGIVRKVLPEHFADQVINDLFVAEGIIAKEPT